jgi:hypothetical protein
VRPHLPVEQRQLALRLGARGLSLREIGPQVNCSHELVWIIARQAPRRPARRDGWVPGPGRLTPAGRGEITIGLRTGQSCTMIAAGLGEAVWTGVAGGSRQRRAGAHAGRGGRVSAPVSRRGGPRLPSWPAPSWLPRSPGGWKRGGRRSRSRAGCGPSSQAIP